MKKFFFQDKIKYCDILNILIFEKDNMSCMGIILFTEILFSIMNMKRDFHGQPVGGRPTGRSLFNRGWTASRGSDLSGGPRPGPSRPNPRPRQDSDAVRLLRLTVEMCPCTHFYPSHYSEGNVLYEVLDMKN